MSKTLWLIHRQYLSTPAAHPAFALNIRNRCCLFSIVFMSTFLLSPFIFSKYLPVLGRGPQQFVDALKIVLTICTDL